MRTPSHPTAARGFSMVELMVAMVIGLIGIIIILQVFEVSEGIKRTTTSGGDAQQNGAIALYVMEHDVRQGGNSFNDTPWAGCSIIGYDNVIAPFDFPVPPATMLAVPVRIFPGANRFSSDQITVFYGSQTHSASASKLDQSTNLSTDPVRVTSVYGFHNGDLILVMEPQLAPPPAVAKPCSLMEVSNIVGNQLFHDSGNYQYTAPGGSPVSVPSRFNKPGGLGVVYTGGLSAKTVVYNLGSAQAGSKTNPVFATYRIQSNPPGAGICTSACNTLSVTPAFTIGIPPAVADNIVHMRAVYGLDDGVNNNTVTFNAAYTANDGIVDRWVDGNTTPNWAFVIAVRIAVLARGALKEKPSGGLGAACDTTTAEPTWSGSAWANPPLSLNTRLDISSNPDGTPNTDWQCYRYRVFEATIPLRNWVWSSS